MKKKIVIIGGAAAATSAAARLRRLDESADIVLYERKNHISFANCELPYHIGNVIKDHSDPIVHTPEDMSARFNMKIHTGHEVLAVDRLQKRIQIRDHHSQNTFSDSYDTLIIASGSSPVRPPIPGIDHDHIFTLWTVPDTEKIKSYIDNHHPRKAIIVGGGFVGMEMTENLRHLGIDVILLDIAPQLMISPDPEIAQFIHEESENNKVDLRLNEGVKRFIHKDDRLIIETSAGNLLNADFVILSMGVKANHALAVSSGLEISDLGGIRVNEYFQTSDPSIYAVGCHTSCLSGNPSESDLQP